MNTLPLKKKKKSPRTLRKFVMMIDTTDLKLTVLILEINSDDGMNAAAVVVTATKAKRQKTNNNKRGSFGVKCFAAFKILFICSRN